MFPLLPARDWTYTQRVDYNLESISSRKKTFENSFALRAVNHRNSAKQYV
jgi:hypothetical protein